MERFKSMSFDSYRVVRFRISFPLVENSYERTVQNSRLPTFFLYTYLATAAAN